MVVVLFGRLFDIFLSPCGRRMIIAPLEIEGKIINQSLVQP